MTFLQQLKENERRINANECLCCGKPIGQNGYAGRCPACDEAGYIGGLLKSQGSVGREVIKELRQTGTTTRYQKIMEHPNRRNR